MSPYFRLQPKFSVMTGGLNKVNREGEAQCKAQAQQGLGPRMCSDSQGADISADYTG